MVLSLADPGYFIFFFFGEKGTFYWRPAMDNDPPKMRRSGDRHLRRPPTAAPPILGN
jgi:hypothetical protein